MEKKIYKKIDKYYGEDIGDLVYELDNNNIKAAKEIVKFLKTKVDRK